MPAARLLQYLALGDSYTIGEGVSPEERWPVQLAGLLRAAGYAVDAPDIIAQTGWTTDELMAGIDEAQLQGPYDLVSLLIGVNNQYRGRRVAEYRRQFAALLERAIGLAGGDASRVFTVSIPDWSVTPFATGRDLDQIASAIDTFNEVAREEAARRGIPFVDVTPASRAAAGNASLFVEDGLHPAGTMYTEWAHRALPVARAVLATP